MPRGGLARRLGVGHSTVARWETGASSLDLAMFADGRRQVIRIDKGWSRIGRSRSADIRLDDPTVSRRHAVVVQTPQGELRVLDDRSLNGIQVNGRRVEWSPLSDGDEIVIGRHAMYFMDTVSVPAQASSAVLAE